MLGPSEVRAAASLEPLEDLVRPRTLVKVCEEVFSSGILEAGRKLKAASGDGYFAAATLGAFTRFNFLMRRAFFRLMHADLNAILDGLRDLDLRGVGTLDCRKADFSANEPVDRLRMICQSWKIMFQAEYSFGQPLRLLVDLRASRGSAGGQRTSGGRTEERVREQRRRKKAKLMRATPPRRAGRRRSGEVFVGGTRIGLIREDDDPGPERTRPDKNRTEGTWTKSRY